MKKNNNFQIIASILLFLLIITNGLSLQAASDSYDKNYKHKDGDDFIFFAKTGDYAAQFLLDCTTLEMGNLKKHEIKTLVGITQKERADKAGISVEELEQIDKIGDKTSDTKIVSWLDSKAAHAQAQKFFSTKTTLLKKFLETKPKEIIFNRKQSAAFFKIILMSLTHKIAGIYRKESHRPWQTVQDIINFCIEFHTNFIQLLINKGLQVNVHYAKSYKTPLIDAKQRGFTDIVELLLKNKAKE